MDKLKQKYSISKNLKEFVIEDGDRKIVIPFPEFDWNEYTKEFRLPKIKIPFAKAQKVFLSACRDFMSGEIPVESLAAIAYKLWLEKPQRLDRDGKELYDVILKTAQLAYYVRKVDDAQSGKFCEYHEVMLSYLNNYGPYYIDYSNRADWSISVQENSYYFEYFGVKAGQRPSLERQQQAVLHLVRDFLAGDISSDALVGSVPVIDWEKLTNPQNSLEKDLENIYYNFYESDFGIRRFGLNSYLYVGVKYYLMNRHLVENEK